MLNGWIDEEKTKKAGMVILAAAAGALATWVLINWLPSLTILFVAVAAGYITWKRIVG